MAIIGVIDIVVPMSIIIMCTLIMSQPVESLTPQVKYVHPSNGSSIPCNVSDPCTFDQYAIDPEQHILSSMIFIFLPGDHQLNTSINLHGVQNVSFQGMSTEGSVTVILAPQVDLTFSSCDDIEITSLNFLLSGDYEYRLIFYNTNSVFIQSVLISTEDENSTGNSAILSEASNINISDSNFVGISGQCGAALQVLDSSEITFTGTNNFANNSGKLGGAIYSTSSKLQFNGISIFTDNAVHSNVIQAGNDMDYSNDDSGNGGAVYANNSQVSMRGCTTFMSNTATICGGAITVINSMVVIDDSSCSSNGSRPTGIVFKNNQIGVQNNPYYGYFYRSGGALCAINSEMKIENTSFLNNFSPESGGAASFMQSNITLYNINAANNMAHYGGAIHFRFSTRAHIHGENWFVNNSAGNNGGAIEFLYTQSIDITGVSYFEGNSAENGGAFDLYGTDTGASISGDIIFTNNNATSGGAIYVCYSILNSTGRMVYKNNTASLGGAIFMTSSDTIFYGDTSFTNNTAIDKGGAVSSDPNSQIYFHREPNSLTSTESDFVFEGNSAAYGGAIALSGNAKMIINPQVEIIFTENKAHHVGGAIFVDIYTSSSCLASATDISDPECFIMLDTCYNSFDGSQLILNFTNNTAENSGSVLYGGSLNQCRGLFKSNAECSMTDQNQEIQSAFDIIFNTTVSSIHPESSSYTDSEFSSNPSTLRIFNDSSNKYCGSPMPVKVFPGGTFNVAMQVVDQYNHSLDGVEVKSTQNNSGDYRINTDSELDTITTNLLHPNITFRVLVYDEDLVKNESKLNFSLYINLEGQCRNYTHFNITVKPCPFGFEFSSDIRKCSCANLLKKFTEDCTIEDITIGRSSNRGWIYISTDHILLYNKNCPLDYCNSSKVYVPQNNSDIQCNKGRSGKLCGDCTQNYSLVFSSLTCKQDCTHTHILLVLPIAALGILLIVILFVLRLTVAAGTINGLLFYVNIVQANNQIFLPTDKANPLTHFYTIFLGWLNLDFGIDTCFYDGMDIYVYSWLQFLFPVYLWVLMFIIILSAHYSQRVAHNLGQNPVAVLATVLLISYGKMLKAIIMPLSWAKLQIITPENSNIPNDTDYVWLYNGNIRYFDHKHIALMVVASLVLLFLFLPYSFLLLCGHWLQAKSHWRLLSWINKLKPFMDAYHAPYKKNSRHWIGLFLLARCGLFLTFALDATGLDDQHLNLLIIISVTAILSIIKGRVYEKWYNDFLESSFLLNLCLLSVAIPFMCNLRNLPLINHKI